VTSSKRKSRRISAVEEEVIEPLLTKYIKKKKNLKKETKERGGYKV
jgi:hypothetical protein